jgi:hypothetical protein
MVVNAKLEACLVHMPCHQVGYRDLPNVVLESNIWWPNSTEVIHTLKRV